MTALTRFSPLRRRARFGPPALFDDWLHDAGIGSLWREPELVPEMRVDVNEDDKAFLIRAEMPGVDKEDIEISVQGNQVSISAELKRESDNKDEKEIIAERSWGKAYRAFALPADVEGDRTEARYDKGVLTLTLPKKANGNVRRIAVS